MKTTLPAHDDIARRAHEIWIAQGSPDGREVDHWLEAERELTAAQPPAHSTPAPAPNPDELAARAAAQKQAARAPQQPKAKPVAKAAPAESGKPLWPTPHSS